MIQIEISADTYNRTLDILSDIRIEIKEKVNKEEDFINKYALQMLWDELDDTIDELNGYYESSSI